MFHTILFICAIAVCLLGCAILFFDVLFTRQTDYCQEQIPAEFIDTEYIEKKGKKKTSGFFVLAYPRFKYTFEGKKYKGKSMNIFFHFFLKEGKLAVPFLRGKTYYIFVNPANPSSFVSSGEQRITFLHIAGIAVTVIGAGFLMFVMRNPF